MKQIIKEQYYDSPCGKIVLASIDDKLCLCEWYEHPSAKRSQRRLERVLKAEFRTFSSPIIEQTKQELDEYFSGKRKSFDIPLLTVGTDFQKQVWDALLEIPYGETKFYKEIALRVNNLKAVRAVAQAIGSNGISILIPCHRVIGSNHSLTGFAGGIEAKKNLLDIESENSGRK